jgi:ketosteroid isomerase-like protein
VSQNVVIAKAAYDAWNKGDLESVLDRLHPDVEWEQNAQVYQGLDPVYHGHERFDRDRALADLGLVE